MLAAYTFSTSESPSYRAFFMSRSFLPGTTVYQAGFGVHVVSTRSKRNGVSAASGAVAPEYESLRTFIWLSMRVSQRAFSAWVKPSSEIMWNTVLMVMLPLSRYAASGRTPYALASLSGYSLGSPAFEPSATRAALEPAPASHCCTAGDGAAVALTVLPLSEAATSSPAASAPVADIRPRVV